MDYWEVQVRLIDNDYDTILDTDGCQVGDTTTFQSVAVPELSEEGYSKFQSQVERHFIKLWWRRNSLNCWNAVA